MDPETKVFLLLLLECQVLFVAAQSQDFSALAGLTENWQHKPPSWVGSDPCADWEGIQCADSRVTSIKLSSLGLVGRLSSEIQSLSELQILDLSFNKGLTGTIPAEIGNLKKLKILILAGCDFYGSIPDAIGSLKQMTFLALNANRLSGTIPRTISNLSNIYWLDLADNQLEGPIPVSGNGGPGLDKLFKANHFHFGNNKLSGEISPGLFNPTMSLVHVLFDNNQLNGTIPSTLFLVGSLEVVRLDGNLLSGRVPSNINNLRNLSELYLSNNNLMGFLPNLTGLNNLTYVDLSNNSFSSSIPSWAASLPSLTTLRLERTGLQGQIPVPLFTQSNLETLTLKNNSLNGTLDIGTAYSKQLQLIDLVDNSITDFKQKNATYNITLMLAGNPVCIAAGTSLPSYCKDTRTTLLYTTPPNHCSPLNCSSNQTSSPNCKCAVPYSGTLSSRVLSISNFADLSYYTAIEQSLMTTFESQNLPVDSVSLSNPSQNSIGYFQLTLKIFPLQDDRFNRSGISSIAFVLSNQIYKPPKFFSPYFYIGDDYLDYAESEKMEQRVSRADLSQIVPREPATSIKSTNTGVVVGAVVGVFIFLVLSILSGIYAVRQKKRAERATDLNPFVNWELNKNSGAAPQLKGARWFSLEDLKKCTNNFSEAHTIGSGGYGKVYLGSLPTGELVAIKRAVRESMQGAVEFKTEIELLSRVHHKNLVGLVGFCFHKGEQMLVYEYIPNGTLLDSLSGKSGIKMDWKRRLKVALGAARGLAYLHELADPPIIHRDIKSSNILLDDRLNAKVADFGLSKLLVDSERGHITTQVKGTMGYLDPEYYMSQQLTEKSDVYSFGVVMLELITARKPIERGKYIVREVLGLLDTSKDLCNLASILDPTITKATTPKGLGKFVVLALRCVRESADERPTMADVVKEIESIMEIAGLNPTAESVRTSESYGEVSERSARNPYGSEHFNYSGRFPSSRVEPQ